MTIEAVEKVTCLRCGAKRQAHNTKDGYCMTRQSRCYWENQQQAELAELKKKRQAEREAAEKAMDKAMAALGTASSPILPLTLADGRRVYAGERGGHRAVMGVSDSVALKLMGLTAGQVQRVAVILETGGELLQENQTGLIEAIAGGEVDDDDRQAVGALLDGDVSAEVVNTMAEDQWQDDPRYVDMNTLDGLAMLRTIQNPSLHEIFSQAMRAAPADLELRQMSLKLFQALDLLGVRR